MPPLLFEEQEISKAKSGFFMTMACASDHTNRNKNSGQNARLHAVLRRELVRLQLQKLASDQKFLALGCSCAVGCPLRPTAKCDLRMRMGAEGRRATGRTESAGGEGGQAMHDTTPRRKRKQTSGSSRASQAQTAAALLAPLLPPIEHAYARLCSCHLTDSYHACTDDTDGAESNERTATDAADTMSTLQSPTNLSFENGEVDDGSIAGCSAAGQLSCR
jgi:hypothetical protein